MFNNSLLIEVNFNKQRKNIHQKPCFCLITLMLRQQVIILYLYFISINQITVFPKIDSLYVLIVT